jgi:adenine-specific DNA-methyltransferase
MPFVEPAQAKVLWHPPGLVGDARPPNHLYFGDNLPVLAALLDDPDVRGQVRLVYIDPPFSTRMVYQSRALADAYSDLLCGGSYVEFLRERLILLRELLANDGSIYVHLDGNMVFHIKVIMDEVFGSSNFRNCITRKKCNPKNYTRRAYGNVCDFILFYSKSDSYVWNRPREQWTLERAEKEYTYVEQATGRRYKKVPVHAPGVRNGETGRTWRGMAPPPGKHWQYTPSTLDEMDRRGEVYWKPTQEDLPGRERRRANTGPLVGLPRCPQPEHKGHRLSDRKEPPSSAQNHEGILESRRLGHRLLRRGGHDASGRLTATAPLDRN